MNTLSTRKKPKSSPDGQMGLKVGVLGSGQLARMLAQAAHPLGMVPRILAGSADDPAAQVCGDVVLADVANQANLELFFAGLDAVTFESEFIDIERIRSQIPSSIFVFPSLDVIEKLQDRLTQKQWLDDNRIPTAAWLPVSDVKDLQAAVARFPAGLVLKQRRFGYDGYGTFVWRKPSQELARQAESHFEILAKSQSGFIAEEWIPFQRELATSFVCGRNAEVLQLPMVESVQVNSRCFSVCGPIRDSKATVNVSKRFCRALKDLNYVGVLAVELFATKQGLLVNELAPRVHNSAHYSIEGLTCSQFEYHLRAGLSWPLPKVQQTAPGFAMVNLLPSQNRAPLSGVELAPMPKVKGKTSLHWYGKREVREGRKMGHLTVLAPQPQKALQAALKWRKGFTW